MRVKRPELVLAGAVLLCLPMLPGVLRGSLAVTAAAERFLIALAVAWLAGAVLSGVIGRYADEARRSEVLRQLEEVRQARQAPVPAGASPPAPGPTPGGAGASRPPEA